MNDNFRKKRLAILSDICDLFYNAVSASQFRDHFRYIGVSGSIFGVGDISWVYSPETLERYNISNLDFMGFIMADHRFEVIEFDVDNPINFTVRVLPL